MIRFLTIFLLCLSFPAFAVTGGTEDKSPFSRHNLMVLSDKGGVCSAVVIKADLLLTAGHCVAGKGAYVAHYRDESGQPVLLPVSKVILHPGYRADAVQKRLPSIDLALVRLSSALPAMFQPAPLGDGKPRAGEEVTLSGWGATAPANVASTGVFRSVTLNVIEPYGPGKVLIWMEAPAANKASGACMGDSGGPIRYQSKVIAITAFAAGRTGKGCGGTSQGVLLGPHMEWIGTYR